MTGSLYLANDSLTVYLTMTEVIEQGAKDLTVMKRGLSKSKQASSGAIVTIADFKKQIRTYLVNGIIYPQGGSTAWQQREDIKTMIEAGGTMRLTNGSDGSYTGNISKWKFKEDGGIPNKYDVSFEFICGSSR